MLPPRAAPPPAPVGRYRTGTSAKFEKELFMALYNADRNVNLGKVPLNVPVLQRVSTVLEIFIFCFPHRR